MKDLIDSCTDDYLIIRNLDIPVPPPSTFERLYASGKSGLASVPEELYKDPETPFYKLRELCLEVYGEPNSYFTLEGNPGSGTERHMDGCDVIHWQAYGSAEWIIESPSKSETTILNQGDLIWFKRGVYHTVINQSRKFSVVFMAMENKYGV